MKLPYRLVFIFIGVFAFTLNSFANQLTDTVSIAIPLGGNAWLNPGAKAVISDNGLTRWTESRDVASVYFRPAARGVVNVALKLRVTAGASKISIKALDKTLIKSVSNTDYSIIDFGKINIKTTGYIKLDISGLEKTGNSFADVTDVIITGSPIKGGGGTAYVKDNHGNFFHWGRRGPSVHLNYKVPADALSTTEWFYNEVTVPVGQDIIGSYFMADGFSGGYFGMQVNSATERRVLFSVWSPYTTDDPKSIPETYKVKLLKKGGAVHGGEFGGEGAGGQSYMTYPWVAGKTYCFLMHAQADIAAETTIFTAYFKPKDWGDWQLMASFKRPQSGSYLQGLHSFLENFAPDNGDKTRKVFFGNQWIVDIEGKWYPLNDALFTGDETAMINYRKDYAGGIEGGSFYLQNCGFFNDFVPLKTTFNKAASPARHPDIDFSKLP
jgi:hypothetical protein